MSIFVGLYTLKVIILMVNFTKVKIIVRLGMVRGFIMLLLLSSPLSHLNAQDVRAGLFPSLKNPARYELSEIRFVGNTSFPDALLRSIISSRASDLSMTRRIVRYVAGELTRNPATPALFSSTLNKIQKELHNELRYFDRATADQDTADIIAFYGQNGFHHTSVHYDFQRDEKKSTNTLVFFITENKQAIIDTVVYYGLTGLPKKIMAQITSASTLRRGDKFTLPAFLQQNEQILRMLRDNGYPDAVVRKPIVTHIAPPVNIDSVTVTILPGKRKKITHITIIDSSALYTRVLPKVAKAYLDIQEGSWYAASAISRSINRLYGLGLFSYVSIDTGNVQYPTTDSTIALQVTTMTRNIHEWGGSVLFGQDIRPNFFNLGGEVFYSNLNIFQAAQRFRVSARALLFNVSDLALLFSEGLNISQFEARLSANYVDPIALMIDNKKVSLDVETLYSQQFFSLFSTINRLQLQSFILRSTFAIDLSNFTFINSALVNIGLDRQVPINYELTLEKALEDAKEKGIDAAIVRQQLEQYGILNDIVQQQKQFITNCLVTFRVQGDKRLGHDPFAPISGYAVDVTGTWGNPWVGASNFLQIQSNILYFTPLMPNLIMAGKLRLAHTWLFDPGTLQGTYIPFEQQLFAGGSNSLRGWGTRELRARFSGDTQPKGDLILDQIIGSASLIEGSLEFRWKFRESASEFDDFFTRYFSRFGLTGFIDFGNTFNSLQETDRYGTMSLDDVLANIALNAGIGIRFDTPAGPLRVDWAFRLYDPMERRTWIVERPLAFRLQIGLGHAF